MHSRGWYERHRGPVQAWGEPRGRVQLGAEGARDTKPRRSPYIDFESTVLPWIDEYCLLPWLVIAGYIQFRMTL
jgi:hypothetical protein